MKYTLSKHAAERIKERSISKQTIKEALEKPTKILYDEEGKILIKKLYKKRGGIRLLLVVGRKIKNQFKIITLIDTSKIKKYL